MLTDIERAKADITAAQEREKDLKTQVQQAKQGKEDSVGHTAPTTSLWLYMHDITVSIAVIVVQCYMHIAKHPLSPQRDTPLVFV